jgi:uncharacterized protein YsxB (DUF464 family)
VIKVYVKRDSGGNIVRYRVKGHAGFDEYGKDIVCSAVSAVIQSNILGLSEVAGIDIGYTASPRHLVCRIPRTMNADKKNEARVLLETMYATLRNIAYNYPGNIVLIDEEVQ